MYCASCGLEIDDTVTYCPTCGHEIGTNPVSTPPAESDSTRLGESSVDGVDYDFVMSIEDAIRRRTTLRLVLDVIALFVTAGFWTGWVAFELISHHYNIKKGNTEPWEEGDEKEFNIL